MRGEGEDSITSSPRSRWLLAALASQGTVNAGGTPVGVGSQTRIAQGMRDVVLEASGKAQRKGSSEHPDGLTSWVTSITDGFFVA